MGFERACAMTDLVEGGALAVSLGDYEVAIARNGDEVFAIEDQCSHANVALSEGDVEGCTIECWLHGSKFDLRSGKPTGLPATEPVATFPVELRAAAGDSGEQDVYIDTDTTLNGVTPA